MNKNALKFDSNINHIDDWCLNQKLTCILAPRNVGKSQWQLFPVSVPEQHNSMYKVWQLHGTNPTTYRHTALIYWRDPTAWYVWFLYWYLMC